jgi:hypothetical protein
MSSLAVAEPQAYVLTGVSHHSLGSPTMMLRLMAREFGCFAIVERGAVMQNLQQEHAPAAGGQLQGGSNISGGQMQVADFVMTPAVQSIQATGLGSVGAPIAPIAQADGPLPAIMVGGLAGQHSGQESGVFSVVIGQDGLISVVGQSANGRQLQCQRHGQRQRLGGDKRQRPGRRLAFNGEIDPNNGTLIGIWCHTNGYGQSTFNGRRQ